MDDVLCIFHTCPIYYLENQAAFDWLRLSEAYFVGEIENRLISSLVGFEKMESQNMKKQYWLINLLMCHQQTVSKRLVKAGATLLVVAFSGQSYAGFIISDDAIAPDNPPQQSQSSAKIQSPATVPGSSVSPVTKPAPDATKAGQPVTSDQEKKTVRIKKQNEYRTNYGDRVAVRHKGRKPAVFGRQVHSSDATLGEMIVVLVPESFQVYSPDDVDMNMPVDGSDSSSWVSGLDYALKGTPYIAEIDWDKKEINLGKDEKIKELETAKAAKLAQDASKKQEEEKKAEKSTKWAVSRQDGLLSLTLDRWCKNSNGQCVQFINQSLHDVPIDSDAEFDGTFQKAVSDLMGSIEQQVGRRFRWKLTSNNVLILTDDSIRD